MDQNCKSTKVTHGMIRVNYDFVSAEIRATVWQSYKFFTNLLEKIGVLTSKEKLVPPTIRLEFLGVIFHMVKMSMEISDQKLKEMKHQLHSWLLRTQAKRKKVESLVGKLQFIAKYMKCGRIFISRLLNWVR